MHLNGAAGVVTSANEPVTDPDRVGDLPAAASPHGAASAAQR
jgi:hypothetical protein